MRARTAAAAGLAAIVAVTTLAPAAEAGKKKRARKPDTNAPPGWTWPPSAAMKRQGDECLIRIDERGVKYERAKREKRIATAIVVENMTFGGVVLESRFRKPPFPMDCHLALALARIGPALRELGVAKLRFSTIHDYRRTRVDGKTKNTLSRHSFGLAVDVFEIVTDDGTVYTVDTDYTAGDSVLHTVESAVNESDQFRMLLTPGNDPVSHDDHYHFEARVKKPKLTKSERKAVSKAKRKKRKAKRKRKRKRKHR